MTTVNIHEAKTHLSKLIEKAINGESFIIARAGKPLVKVTAIEQSDAKQVPWMGFMKDQMIVPKDLKVFGREEIEEMSGLKD